MNTSKTKLIAILVIGAAVFAAQSASAGGFSFGGGGGGGGGGNKGSFKVSFGNNNNHHKNHNYDHYYHGHHHHVRYYAPPVRLIYSQCYHPQFQSCYVFPGDTWYSISKRNYGVDFLCRHIASYNGFGMSSQLVVGQQLQLPVVNANGSLAASNAPMPAPLATPSLPVAAPSQPVAAPSTASEESLPSVAVGSTLKFSGESLGTEKGIVRLQISGMILPVEVIEWTADSVKIQLPKVNLSRAVKAELEVLRADGSVASNSAIELTPAVKQVALGN